MVRLNLQGVWLDLSNFVFEMKWKHPISTSLVGESATYSTDITVPLSPEARALFDYQIFTKSTKTNK